jgi:hypothetical protein
LRGASLNSELDELEELYELDEEELELSDYYAYS